MLFRLIKDEDGQSMVEYALIIALIAVLLVGALKLFGDTLFKRYKESANALTKSYTAG